MTIYYKYDEYVQDALRSVVINLLHRVEKEGILGNHNFYITFNTQYKGVVMPDYLCEKYPDEITIVLQYQFWNLKVYDDRFSISLSFNGKKEDLTVPFKSISSFVDPYVKFGLQFVIDNNKGFSKLDEFEKSKNAQQNYDDKKDSKDDEKDNSNVQDNVVVDLASFRKNKID